jgi:thiamin-phosphate kinase
MTVGHMPEYSQIMKLTRYLPRTRFQQNDVFESDCEIVKLKNEFLACSTDSIGEEIDIGLYLNPELWGWMTVMASASDLAASGANPIGLLLNNQWKYQTSEKEKSLFFKGVKIALQKTNIALLGGDSGSGASHCHSATVLGNSSRKPLTRIGVKPGDVVVLLGRKKLGNGPSLAYRFLFQKPKSFFDEKYFRPIPHVKLMTHIRPLVKAAIDTSDGLGVSLQILRELNHVGFHLQWSPDLASSKALSFCKKANLHPLMLAMGDHGDYQTLLVIDEKHLTRLKKQTRDLVIIGKVVSFNKKISIDYQNQNIILPTEKVVNCAREVSAIHDLAIEMNSYFLT